MCNSTVFYRPEVVLFSCYDTGKEKYLPTFRETAQNLLFPGPDIPPLYLGETDNLQTVPDPFQLTPAGVSPSFS